MSRRRQKHESPCTRLMQRHLFPTGEPIVALDLDLEVESGVSLLVVTDLVSHVWFYYIYIFDFDWLVGPPEGEASLCSLYQVP